jgi:deoxyribonuclease V
MKKPWVSIGVDHGAVATTVKLAEGRAHPRGLGIASHIGLHIDVPVVGVGKSLLVGTHAKPGTKRGDWRSLDLDGKRIGLVVTTQDGTKPIFVSVGNRIGLFPAARRVLDTATKYRLPEPIRHADSLSRRLARASSGSLAQ